MKAVMINARVSNVQLKSDSKKEPFVSLTCDSAQAKILRSICQTFVNEFRDKYYVTVQLHEKSKFDVSCLKKLSYGTFKLGYNPVNKLGLVLISADVKPEFDFDNIEDDL